MDSVHRKELKHDKFVEEVGHSLEFAAEHKSEVIKYAIGALVLIVAGIAIYLYLDSQTAARQEDLRAAMRIQEAQIGPASSESVLSYPTEAEKQKAVEKGFTDLHQKYPGKHEGMVAEYFLGTTYADNGKGAEAEKALKDVAENAKAEIASQAKLSLAQLYASQGRNADAEKLLKNLMEHPTALVSKVQATVSLARMIAPSKPDEARKLLEPLRSEQGAAGRVALTALAELPPK
ncbi:MAG TPA: tetratricopeptide repeat protein [Bryobacteraceae bacterium]|nr:tetratricopeptide repeat protein [Bryobacteraceae bacterium]